MHETDELWQSCEPRCAQRTGGCSVQNGATTGARTRNQKRTQKPYKGCKNPRNPFREGRQKGTPKWVPKVTSLARATWYQVRMPVRLPSSAEVVLLAH